MLERAIADYNRLGGAGEPAFFDRGIPDLVGYAELFALDTSAALAACAALPIRRRRVCPTGLA
jgi:predicted ATPase